MKRKVAVIIPTLNAGKLWGECLRAICNQSLSPDRRLVIDSGSLDETCHLAIDAGFEVRTIKRSEFNHGGTRQWAAEYLDDMDLLIFLTQDAVLAAPDSLEKLTRCFENQRVALAYGRQLPRRNADLLEAHARCFNYGSVSVPKNLAARESLGAKVYFCSNSFAAYRRSTLLELGGFNRHLILGEDAEYAARAILAGYDNIYCAEATVYHSHKYSAAEVLWRYFDTGAFHIQNQWLEEEFGSHGSEGLRFFGSELRYVGARAPLQLARSLIHTFAKILGYRLGRLEGLLPLKIKKRLSMHPAYWDHRQARHKT